MSYLHTYTSPARVSRLLTTGGRPSPLYPHPSDLRRCQSRAGPPTRCSGPLVTVW